MKVCNINNLVPDLFKLLIENTIEVTAHKIQQPEIAMTRKKTFKQWIPLGMPQVFLDPFQAIATCPTLLIFFCCGKRNNTCSKKTRQFPDESEG